MKNKTISVNKRTSAEDKLNSKRWTALLSTASIPWEELSDEWKEFYVRQGFIESASKELNKFIDAAIKADEEKA